MQSSSFGGRVLSRTVSLALIALVVEAAPTFGQFPGAAPGQNEPMIRVGFGGGVSIPVSDASTAFQNGVDGAGFVLVNLLGAGMPALRFSFTYDRFNFKPAVAAGGNGATNTSDPGHSQMYGGTAGIKIHLLPGRLQPFLMAGVGAFNVNDFVNLAGGSSVSSSKTDFGLDGGGGIELRFGHFAAFAEGRIQNVFTQTGGLINRPSIQSIPLTFGIMY